ncbi:hypothetical protein D3C78_1504430 [compost metagenome]
MGLQVDEKQLVPRFDAVFREVDDDVEALGDALGRQDRVVVLFIAIGVEIHAAVERYAVLHDVAVVGDHVERHTAVRHTGVFRPLELAAGAFDFPHQRQFEVARHRAVENAEAIAACAHVEGRFPLPVDQ